MQHVHIYTQSPKINKVFPIYEYQTCVFEEIQLGVKGWHLVKKTKRLVSIAFYDWMQFLKTKVVN